MGTESGGSPAILLLGNGGDELKKALGLEWGAGHLNLGNGGMLIKNGKNDGKQKLRGLGRGLMGVGEREEREERNEGNKRKKKNK